MLIIIINLNEAFDIEPHLIAFNFYNIETISAILMAAEKKNKNVIVAFGESYIEHTPLSLAVALVESFLSRYNINIVLHLDHCSSISTIESALDLGFTSVMYDGSKLPFAENIAKTKIVTGLARRYNATVEGELGYLNSEDGSDSIETVYTSVAESEKYVNETQVDALAIAVGNAHGLYTGECRIAVERIREISQVVKTPLVLHGSSGLSKAVLQECFASGIRKINVNTELAISGAQSVYDYICKTGSNARLEKALLAAEDGMSKIVEKFLDI